MGLKGKKDAGVLAQMLPLFVGILLLTMLCMLLLSATHSIRIKNQIDLTARRGLLLLESSGYLDGETEAQLKDQLSRAGVIACEIHVTGMRSTDGKWGIVTEKHPSVYGQMVRLEISGIVKLPFLFGEQEKAFSVVRTSTGKN